MMPSTRLVPVRSYFEPTVYERMEQARARLRRISISRFVEDAVLEKLERMEGLSRPIQLAPNKRSRAAG
jgi:hypothetical protein